MPSGSWAVTALILYKLVVFVSLGVLTSIIETDTGGRVSLPIQFYYWVVQGLWDWLCDSLPVNGKIMFTCGHGWPVPNWYDPWNTWPRMYLCLRLSMTTTQSLNTLAPICRQNKALAYWSQGFAPPAPAMDLLHGINFGLHGECVEEPFGHAAHWCASVIECVHRHIIKSYLVPNDVALTDLINCYLAWEPV